MRPEHVALRVARRSPTRYRIVLFDHVGSGSPTCPRTTTSVLDARRYAADVLDIVHEHDLRDVIFVGHSVSAMIGVLAATASRSASPRWSWSARRRATSTTPDYVGGFGRPTSTRCWSRWTQLPRLVQRWPR
jgi:sigma-B regulation protein RsbQ